MYALYARHYDDVCPEQFLADLSDKTHVLRMLDEEGIVRGFSTIELSTSTVAGRPIRVLFSGDTVIDRRYWGHFALARQWLRFAGRIYRQDITPLYWLLIVKGHRTYRYLSTFAKRYVPHHQSDASSNDEALRDTLAVRRFGDAYDPASAVVRFNEPRGRLTPLLADIPENHRRLAPVAFFLERNPGYRAGDELVCLCELAPWNLRPMAKRAFEGEHETAESMSVELA